MIDTVNRIGAACWYRVTLRSVSRWRAGHLRMWGTHHEEFESGPGLFPAAVVEDDETMAVAVVFAEYVCFAAKCPGEADG